jgi:hypothetical protein
MQMAIEGVAIARLLPQPDHDGQGQTNHSPKFKTCGRMGSLYATVDNFVSEKASNFNKAQQSSTSTPQRIQQQSLRINKNP